MARKRSRSRSRSKSPSHKGEYYRKGYTRSDGTKVKGSWVDLPGSGKSRGRKTGGKYSKSKGYKAWISPKRKGKLGQGFLTKMSTAQRKKALEKCLKNKRWGATPEKRYKSCLGSVMVLNRSKELKAKYGKELDEIRNWFVKTYGGGKLERSPSHSRKRSLRKRRSSRRRRRSSRRKRRSSRRKRRSSRRKRRKSRRKSRRKRRKSRSRSAARRRRRSSKRKRRKSRRSSRRRRRR